jgi:hypothetical protein
MTKQIYKIGISMAFLPIFAMPSTDVGGLAFDTDQEKIEISMQELREERAKKIEIYFSERSMPLATQAMEFVLAAEKYGLEWTLLPAVAIRESSGGKNETGCTFNPFGWASCRVKFKDYPEAIDTVAKNLGGANSRTAYYYAGKSSKEKLYYYNGTVIKSYPDEVLAIMKRINNQKVETIELAEATQ